MFHSLKMQAIYVFMNVKQSMFIYTYLLQVKLEETWQVPFHLVGGGPNPLSSKLVDSGQIPESSIPMIMSLSTVLLSTCCGKPMKSHDLVVCSLRFWFGNTETTPSMPNIYI